MEFTIGFFVIFICIVVPGLLFQRFYFKGEFSKQFSTKENIYMSVFYSIIPGLITQLIGAVIYFSSRESYLTTDCVYGVFSSVFSGNIVNGSYTDTFISHELHLFLYHIVNIYVLAMFLGSLTYYFVRYFNLDSNTKILRFKNQWYYVFSGEIKNLHKFKIYPLTDLTISSTTKDQGAIMTVVEVTTDNSNLNETEKYTGYLIDYDLNSNDISQLERLYLSKVERVVRDKRNEIKADVFILPATRIKCLSIFYEYDENKRKLIEESTKQIIYSYVYIFGVVASIGVTYFVFYLDLTDILQIFFNQNELSLDNSYYFFIRLLLLFGFTQFIFSFLPTKEKERYTFKFKHFLKKIIGWIIFTLIIRIVIGVCCL
ncbi:hypothetical protein AB9K24_08545 [Meridianimaribacter flavus]